MQPPPHAEASSESTDLRMRKLAVSASFAAQGLGYAAVMTALPSFQKSWNIDDSGVALILLGTCVMAGLGSVAADLIAVRWGSRIAVCAALSVQAAAVMTMAFAPSFAFFIAAVVIYGIGLGTMDAGQNMQGTALEARAARPHLGRFYAAYTAAAGLGALAMSGFLSAGAGAVGALVTAALGQLGVAALAAVGLDPAQENAADHQSTAREVRARDTPVEHDTGGPTPLPRAAIWTVGLVLMAVYMLDSAVSTWSTVYLTNAFAGLASLAPLGYALYQGTTLLSRLVTDRLEEHVGMVRLGVIALGIGIVGCGVVAVVPAFAGAIVGFAIAGVAGGILIPLTFGAAGRILPARRDEIIARVNLFNYVGVVLGAVTIGAIAAGKGIGLAFLIPAAGLFAAGPLIRRMGTRSYAAGPPPTPTLGH